jgi:hypothetical protein
MFAYPGPVRKFLLRRCRFLTRGLGRASFAGPILGPDVITRACKTNAHESLDWSGLDVFALDPVAHGEHVAACIHSRTTHPQTPQHSQM